MKPISSIKQADSTQGTGKLTYIGVAQSSLKLRILPSGKKDWVLRVATTIKQKRKQQVLHVAKFDKSQILDQVRMQATKLLNEHAQTSTFEGNNDKKVDLQLPSIWAEYINCAEYRENTAATQLQKKYSFQRYSKFWEAQGKSLITQVTRADVRAFQNSRKDKPVASNRDLSHMAHFIQFAVNEGYISENFARNIKREYEAPGSDGIRLEELQNFYDFLDSYPKEFCHETRSFRINEDGTTYKDANKLVVSNFAKFIVLTGVRVSEARNLTYLAREAGNYVHQNNCNITGKTKLFLRLNHHKTVKITGPRDLQLIESAYHCLGQQVPFRLANFKDKNIHVFPSKRGKGPISRKTIDSFIRELNLRFKDFDSGNNVTLRSLRHTFARYALQQGLTHDELAIILGHTTSAMVRKYYAIADTAQISRSIAKLERHPKPL